MKLIIDIPDNEYNQICELRLHNRTFYDDAIRNGTPLKTGHWKRHCIPTKSELWWECSECKHALAQMEKTKYCPNCGAKMVEQERSDKE